MNDVRRTAAFFDLDKTIIATSSSAAFSDEFFDNGLLSRSEALRAAYAQFLFSIGGADARKTERLRDALSEIITGWNVAQVRAIVAETVQEHIDPVVYQEALSLIRRHRALGRDIVIISASASVVVDPIADMLGADIALGSDMAIADGKYTGEISRYCFGEHKAEAIAELAEERDYDLERCYAYSDSITDAPMLDAVGQGFAVNPDRTMRRAAAEHGWGVLHFRKPVAIREDERRRATWLGAICAGIVVGLASLVVIRKRG